MADSSADKPRYTRSRDDADGERVAREKSHGNGSADRPAARDGPDVYLNVPRVQVEEIVLEVENLEAHVSLNAAVLDLLKLNVGADVFLGKVGLEIKGVEAQALLEVHLDNVAAIVDRVLTTLDRNPEILRHIARGAESAVRGVGKGAGKAVGELGEGASEAVESAGKGAGEAVGELGKGTSGAVESAGKGAGEAVGELGKEAGGAVRDVGKEAGGAVRGVGKEAGGAVRGVGEGAGKTAGDVVDKAGQSTDSGGGDSGNEESASTGDSGADGDQGSGNDLETVFHEAQESVEGLSRALTRMASSVRTRAERPGGGE